MEAFKISEHIRFFHFEKIDAIRSIRENLKNIVLVDESKACLDRILKTESPWGACDK